MKITNKRKLCLGIGLLLPLILSTVLIIPYVTGGWHSVITVWSAIVVVCMAMGGLCVLGETCD